MQRNIQNVYILLDSFYIAKQYELPLLNKVRYDREDPRVHAYLKSVLRLCSLILEGFRGSELGMMGVVVRASKEDAEG